MFKTTLRQNRWPWFDLELREQGICFLRISAREIFAEQTVRFRQNLASLPSFSSAAPTDCSTNRRAKWPTCEILSAATLLANHIQDLLLAPQ